MSWIKVWSLKDHSWRVLLLPSCSILFVEPFTLILAVQFRHRTDCLDDDTLIKLILTENICGYEKDVKFIAANLFAVELADCTLRRQSTKALEILTDWYFFIRLVFILLGLKLEG